MSVIPPSPAMAQSALLASLLDSSSLSHSLDDADADAPSASNLVHHYSQVFQCQLIHPIPLDHHSSSPRIARQLHTLIMHDFAYCVIQSPNRSTMYQTRTPSNQLITCNVYRSMWPSCLWLTYHHLVCWL